MVAVLVVGFVALQFDDPLVGFLQLPLQLFQDAVHGIPLGFRGRWGFGRFLRHGIGEGLEIIDGIHLPRIQVDGQILAGRQGLKGIRKAGSRIGAHGADCRPNGARPQTLPGFRRSRAWDHQVRAPTTLT